VGNPERAGWNQPTVGGRIFEISPGVKIKNPPLEAGFFFVSKSIHRLRFVF
jgi:hypothetical protein